MRISTGKDPVLLKISLPKATAFPKSSSKSIQLDVDEVKGSDSKVFQLRKQISESSHYRVIEAQSGYQKFKLNSSQNILNSPSNSVNKIREVSKDEPYLSTGSLPKTVTFFDRKQSIDKHCSDQIAAVSVGKHLSSSHTQDKFQVERPKFDIKSTLEQKNARIRELEKELAEANDRLKDLKKRLEVNQSSMKSIPLEDYNLPPSNTEDFNLFKDLINEKSSPDAVRFGKIAVRLKKALSDICEMEKKNEQLTKGSFLFLRKQRTQSAALQYSIYGIGRPAPFEPETAETPACIADV
jgi:hypothetical protein